MKYFSKIIGIFFVLSLFTFSAQQVFAFSGAGAGTGGDPYQITDCAELEEIQSSLAASYILMNNIDCSGGSTLSMGTFTGDFNGAGYTVDVNITGTSGNGLFSSVSGAHIYDIRITGSITSTGTNNGGIAGSADSSSIIERVVNEASIRGNGYTGGIVGSASSVSILNSYNTGEISSTTYQFGGIAGLLSNSSIINSYNRGQVGRLSDAMYHLGGITGWQTSTVTITNSFNAGAVLSGQSTFFFGGLWGNDQDGSSGNSSATLTNNFFDISRSTRTMCGYDNGGQAVNPVVGDCEGVNSGNSSIHYFKDNDTNEPLASWDFATIWETDTDEYPSLRSIIADGGVVNDDPDITGPVILEVTPITTPNYSSTQNYIFTTDEAGTIYTGGSCAGESFPATVGSNTVQFSFGTGTYSDCTLYVEDESGNESNTINMTEFIVDLSFRGTGTGTEIDPYIVSSCSELQSLSNNIDSDQYVELSENIDCSDTATWNEDLENPGEYFGFEPIEGFNGILNGNGYTISGLTIDRPDQNYIGLFDQIQGNAFIYNINLTDINIAGGVAYTGGFAGYIYGTVVGVHVAGTLDGTGSGRAGGFAGGIQTWGGVLKSSFEGTATGGVTSLGGFAGYAINTIIADSYAQATVSGALRTGGFVGETGSCCTDILRSYASGTVAGNDYTGGFIGYAVGGSDNSIVDNFAVNTVTGGGHIGAFIGVRESSITITNNYYDELIETSAPCIEAGGEIEDECTGISSLGYFYDSVNEPLASWDFDTVWSAEIGDYPTLLAVESLSVPSVPQNLSVSVDGLEISIDWDVPSDEGGLTVTSYEIQVKESTSTWLDPLILDTSTSDTAISVDDDDIEFDTDYDIRVLATNALGDSEYAETSSTTDASPEHNISTCEELAAMDDDSGTYADTFDLVNDIDCSGIEDFEPLGWGSWDSTFRGTLDGHGYTISNLTIFQDNEEIGLFSEISRATIKNLTLESGSVTGIYSVGAVVGYAYESTISNVHSDMDVIGQFNEGWGWGGETVGGLVGYLEYAGESAHDVSVSDSSSSGFISGEENAIGGLIGYMYAYPDDDEISFEASITNNEFTGTINTEGATSSDVGGIIGKLELDSTYDDDTEITATISGNTVDSSGIYGVENVGGLIGEIESYTEYENNIHNITIADNILNITLDAADGYVGGLIGSMGHEMDDDNQSIYFTVEGNSVDGTISSGGYYAGGLIGYEEIENDYDDSTVYVTITENRSLADISSQNYAGGLVGYLSHYDYSNGEFIDLFSENYATGAISASGEYVGGFIGAMYVSGHNLEISDSYFNGELSSAGGVGGLIGQTESSDGMIDIYRSYAAGSILSPSGDNVGGLVGKNNEGTLGIYGSFAANSISGASDGFGAILGTNNSENGALLTPTEVYYDQGQNPIGCVDNEAVADCTPVNTEAAPDSEYFINNSEKPVFNAGEGSWNFTDVWATEIESYPLLRTTFEVADVTPPVLTEVTPISSRTSISNAVYHFSTSEECSLSATVISQSGAGGVVSGNVSEDPVPENDLTFSFSGLRAGGTYSVSIACIDDSDNESNSLEIGPFTVISSGGSDDPSTKKGRERVRKVWDERDATPLNETPLGAGTCSIEQQVTQNLKQGARDGLYHAYARATAKDVALVQGHINRILAIYFDQAAGPVDGIFGPLTKQGVQRLQQALQDKLGLDLGPAGADGIVGPFTRTAINGSCPEVE